jgi:hypothetical protein
MNLAAGVYLSEAPDPLHPTVTHCMKTGTPVLFRQGRGRGVGDPVRRLEGASSREGVENTIMTGDD